LTPCRARAARQCRAGVPRLLGAPVALRPRAPGGCDLLRVPDLLRGAAAGDGAASAGGAGQHEVLQYRLRGRGRAGTAPRSPARARPPAGFSPSEPCSVTLRAEKALVALLLAALLHPAFQGVAVLVSARSVLPPAWLLTPLDRWLPVVPAAVWVYLSWYPAAAVVLLAGRATFRRAALAYVVAFPVCVGVYPVFPLGIARPEPTHQD